MVMVIPPPPDVPVEVPAVVPAVVAAVVAPVVAAVVAPVVAAVLPDGAALAAGVAALSLPQAAATKAKPTASAANVVLRFVVLTWISSYVKRREVGSVDRQGKRKLVGKVDHILAPSSPIGASRRTISLPFTDG
jgi:hypothetical protein